MTTQPSFPNANEQMLFLTEGEIEMFSCVFSIFDAGGSVGECMCVYTYTHTHTAHGMLDVSPKVGTRHVDDPKYPDGLNLGKYVFVYVYKVHICIHILEGGMTNCFFS